MMTAIHLRCPKGSFYIFCAARTQQEANRHHDVNDIFVSLFKKRNVFIAVVYTQQPPILCSNLPFFSQKKIVTFYTRPIFF